MSGLGVPDSTGARASFPGLRGCGKAHLAASGVAPIIHSMAVFAALEVCARELLFRPAGARPFPTFPRLAPWATFLRRSAAQTVDPLSAGVVEILVLTHLKALRHPKSRFSAASKFAPFPNSF
jgi:hypothetical protein